ncbi:hypothetical protein A2U01_0015913, partial [Trifolium medium]|nr:hypothetical protein [Trifolium medium]
MLFRAFVVLVLFMDARKQERQASRVASLVETSLLLVWRFVLLSGLLQIQQSPWESTFNDVVVLLSSNKV